jgi:hypothetical protein
MKQRLVLTNDTDFFKNWQDPQVPMFSTFHLFHIKNPTEFMNGKAAAELEQVGPFVFSKKLVRKIYGFSENDTQITFRTSIYFHFLPELSDMTAFDQNITMLNLPLAVSCMNHTWKSEIPCSCIMQRKQMSTTDKHFHTSPMHRQ